MVQYKKEVLKNKLFFLFLHSIKMTKKTLKFKNIRVDKKKFHMSKKSIDLMSVNLNKIVVSDRFNYNEACFK